VGAKTDAQAEPTGVPRLIGGLLSNEVAVRPAPWATPGAPVAWWTAVPDFRPLDWMSEQVEAGTDLFAQFALAAAGQAIQQAGLKDFDPRRTAVVHGTSMGGMRALLKGQHQLENSGPDAIDRPGQRADPVHVPGPDRLRAGTAAQRHRQDPEAGAQVALPSRARSSRLGILPLAFSGSSRRGRPAGRPRSLTLVWSRAIAVPADAVPHPAGVVLHGGRVGEEQVGVSAAPGWHRAPHWTPVADQNGRPPPAGHDGAAPRPGQQPPQRQDGHSGVGLLRIAGSRCYRR
jgi:hypothetical protein